MSMAILQFYKNSFYYPHYKEALTGYGASMDCTPVGINQKGGTLRVRGDMAYFNGCNYLALTRDQQTIYAWVDNLTYRTPESFDVTYSVDAWRTYKNRVNLGTQFLKRTPTVTNKLDSLLGGTIAGVDVHTQEYLWGNYHTRVLVVQVVPEPAYVVNNTPVQPTPYHFYFAAYNPDNWQSSSTLVNFFSKLRGSSAITNIITMYSLPYMDISGMNTVGLPLMEGKEQVDIANGFKFLSGTNNVKDLLTRSRLIELDTATSDLTRTPHTVQVLIPEAGIMSIPDEYLLRGNLKVRQDIDLFSGASNYTLTYGEENKMSGISIRGSSTSSIPVISSPYDTYISQNQNALTTSLIGDVASVAVGAGTFLMAPNMLSGGVALSGVKGLVSDYSTLQDRQNMAQSNPPSFLGTAMANHFSSKFFVIVKRPYIENAALVNSRYGYPLEMVGPLVFPSSGYVETQNCNVTTDGTVPRWAVDDINKVFDDGLFVH